MDLKKIYRGMENGTEALQENFETIALAFYPIGAIYQSTISTDPATLFGGSWERIQGRFLVGASSSDTDFTAAKAGGTKNLINHVHVAGQGIDTVARSSGTLVASKTNYTGNFEGTIQQLPPYLAVYMWKRTA